jgi:hypothetical protein
MIDVSETEIDGAPALPATVGEIGRRSSVEKERLIRTPPAAIIENGNARTAIRVVRDEKIEDGIEIEVHLGGSLGVMMIGLHVEREIHSKIGNAYGEGEGAGEDENGRLHQERRSVAPAHLQRRESLRQI